MTDIGNNKRKRTVSSHLNQYGNMEFVTKRANVDHIASSDDTILTVKVLIPSAVTGVILGKGGETIIKLQTQYCANIKLSKAGDFYPGTTERVCVIVGPPTGVRSLLGDIVNKIHQRFLSTGVSADFLVKLVVPYSTAGMIVGDNDEFIEAFQNEFFVFIETSPKNCNMLTQERCITVKGAAGNVRRALDIILQTIAADPLSGSCPNVSYSESASDDSHPSNVTGIPGSTGTIHTGFIPNRPQFVVLRNSLQRNGFTRSSVEEIVAAVYTLVGYEFLTVDGNDVDNVQTLEKATAHCKQMLSGGDGNLSAGPRNYCGKNGNNTSAACANATYAAAGDGSTMTGYNFEPYCNNSPACLRPNDASAAGFGTVNSGANYCENSSVVGAPPPPPRRILPHHCPTSATISETISMTEYMANNLLGHNGSNIENFQWWYGVKVDTSSRPDKQSNQCIVSVTVTGSPPAVQNAVFYMRQYLQQGPADGWSTDRYWQQQQWTAANNYYQMPGQELR